MSVGIEEAMGLQFKVVEHEGHRTYFDVRTNRAVFDTKHQDIEALKAVMFLEGQPREEEKISA